MFEISGCCAYGQEIRPRLVKKDMHKPLPDNLRITREVSLLGEFRSVVRDSESGDLFVGNNIGKIYRVDLTRATEDPYPRVIEAHISYVSSLVLAGDCLISSGSDHRLVWWDRRTHDKVREVGGHPRWIRQTAVSADGAFLATVCDDMIARVFDAHTGKLIHELSREHEILNPYDLRSKLYCCAFSPDGKHVAAGGQAGRIVVWNVASGKKVIAIDAPHFCTWDTNGHTYGGIRSIDFSPDGKLLAAGGNQAGDTSNVGGSKSMIQIYDWNAGEQTHDFRVGGNYFYERVRFHPGGEWLVGAAGAGTDSKIVFFDLEKKEVAHEKASGMLTFDLELEPGSDAVYAVGRRGNSTLGTKGTLARWVWDLTRETRRI
jgi:WD40 repeat protein